MDEKIQKTLKKLLDLMTIKYKKIKMTDDKKKSQYKVNIESDESSLLIGYHGETIYALQHILKILLWNENPKDGYSIFLDIDNYRKRQEESVIQMAERKVEQVRKTEKNTILLPMSPYFRRIVHLHLMEKGFEDIETESIGEGDHRQVVIKLKQQENA